MTSLEDLHLKTRSYESKMGGHRSSDVPASPDIYMMLVQSITELVVEYWTHLCLLRDGCECTGASIRVRARRAAEHRYAASSEFRQISRGRRAA